MLVFHFYMHFFVQKGVVCRWQPAVITVFESAIFFLSAVAMFVYRSGALGYRYSQVRVGIIAVLLIKSNVY